jgi:hypothetical protein
MSAEKRTLTPGVARFVAGGCVAFGVLMFLCGGAMLAFAIVNMGNPAPDSTSFLFSALGIFAGSFLWFALGSIVGLLSQIEENTRPTRT